MKRILKKPLRVAQIFGLLVASTVGLNAQGTIQIGSGTQTTLPGSTTIPVTNRNYSYSQQIVTAAEYTAGGGIAGNITKIRWKFTNIGTNPTVYGDWDVYIGHTTKSSFASNTDWEPIGNLTQVYSGNIHSLAIPPANNVWFEVEFSTPFNYNGTDNIVVAVNEKTPGWIGGPTIQAYTSSENTGIVIRRDSPDSYTDLPNIGDAFGRRAILPQLQFEGQSDGCLPPLYLGFTQTSLTSADLSWTSNGSNVATYDVEWGTAGFSLGNGTPINGLTTTSTSVTTIIDTNYEFYVRQNCGADGSSGWAGPYAFKTGYCIPTQAGSEYIESVSTTGANINLSNLNNGSQTGGYGDFTALPFAIAPGGTFTLTVTAGFDNFSYPEAFAVWIDWNNNGIFEASEHIHSTGVLPSSPTPSFTHTITAPSTEGSYRMRIVMQYNQVLGADDSCITSDGETEDYTLTVTSDSGCFLPTALGFTQTSLTGGNLSWLASGANAVSYDVEWGTAGFSQGSGTPINGLTTTSTSVTTIQDTDYEFYVRQNCGTDGESSWAGPFAFRTGYCIPTYTFTSDYISSFITLDATPNVTYGPITSAPAGNYEDLTATVITQPTGVNINFTRTHVGTSHTLRIWVDWNGDGIFDPITEQVYGDYDSVTNAPGVIDLSNTVPGSYRMRIRSRWGLSIATFDACENLSYGSTIDYTLTLITPPPCLPPSNLGFTQTSLTSADLTWNANGGNVASYDVQWGTAGFSLGSGTFINGISTTSTSVTTIQDTDYEFYVRQNCGTDGESNWVGPFPFRTGYCVPSPENDFDWIEGFSTSGAISNIINTGNGGQPNGYADFTSMSATVTAGVPFNFTVDFVSTFTDEEGLAIWIDENNNGIFETTERVYTSNGTTTLGIFSGSITAPATAGTYRMRVVLEYDEDNPSDPCLSVLYYGDVEDYTLVVIASCSEVTALSTSNLTQNSVAISWTAGGTETAWNIEYGVTGFSQGSGTTINGVTNPYTITGLTAGTSYDVYVQADCGSGSTSTWVMTTFTTDAAFSCPSPLNAGTVTTTPDSGSAGTIFDVTATGYDTGADITYTWEKSEDNGATWIPVGTANNPTYADLIGETAPASGEVAYRLTISCGGNTESASATFTVTVSRSDFDVFGFSYYPNPVNDMLHFSSNTTIENVVITNMLGQQVNVSVSSDNKNLDMSNLPTGNYLVKVTIEGVAKTIKVVKQ